ncbi:hypothetical protein N7534_002250 [Penicillium rubens]|nr:hypothetical protein N7534_002250 [Penicillium rubens]
MSSTFSAPSTVTQTVFQTVTTPFIQASSCLSIYDLITLPILRPAGGSSTISPVAFLISDAANPQFSACQPNGWNDGDAASQFHFSPAVCPSDWTYYEIRRTSSKAGKGNLDPYSTAYCCASGYQLWNTLTSFLTPFYVTSLPTPCYQYVHAGSTSITVSMSPSGTETTKIFTEGYIAHAAWGISWAASDTASMSPALPLLDSEQYIPTWVPGQSVTAPSEPKSQNDSALTALGYLLMVGLPLIGVAIIACAVWCCFTIRRARRREAPQLEQWRLEHPTSIFRTPQ